MKKQWVLGIVLLCVSFSVRLLFLGSPNEVVFDEVHWGKYVTGYASTGKNFFDVHPPHGKLLVTGLLKLTDFDGLQNFEKIGTEYTHVSPWTIRILPAIAGSLVPFVLFLIFLYAGITIENAFLFSLCSSLDNALVLQSRVMGLYPMLLLALVSSLLFVLLSLDSEKKRWLWLTCAGIASGFAAGFQFTGIAALFIVFLVLGARKFKKKIEWKDFFAQISFLSFVAAIIYLAGWWIHFSLLPSPGVGDAFYRNTGNFVVDLFEIHYKMYRASATLTTFHQDASAPWSWPIMTKPIFYWQGKDRSLYFIGNPVVWWGISFLFVWDCFQKRKKKQDSVQNERKLILVSFLISYIPLMLMKRVLFLYHYLTPLTYAELFVGMSEKPYTGWKFYTAVILVILGFIYLSPVTYGYSMPPFYWKSLPWRLVH